MKSTAEKNNLNMEKKQDFIDAIKYEINIQKAKKKAQSGVLI